MHKRTMILLSPLLLATLGFSGLAAPQAVAAPTQAIATAVSPSYEQPPQGSYTRGFRDGYRQGHDDGLVDGKLDCKPRRDLRSLVPPQNDYDRGFADGYPKGYQSGYDRYCHGRP